MNNQHFESRVHHLIRKLREVKEYYGTLTNSQILHVLELARYDWIGTPPVHFSGALTDFFVYCVEMNVFDHVQTKDGKKYSNFGGFNRSGYREVEAFLRTLSNYESVQFYEIEVQNDIDLTASIVYLHLVKSRTIEQEEALLLSGKFDFFAKTPDGIRKLAEYNAHKNRIEIAKQVIEAMPDFEPTNFYADIADITAVVCSVSGWEHPGERLDFEKSNEAYLIAKSTQTT